MDIATLGLATRYQDIEGANRALGKFSGAARKAEGSAKSMGTGATGAARRMVAANDNVARSANRMAGVYRRAGRIIGAALVAAFAAVGLRNFISATVEANQVQAQLGAAIASTGGAAGRSIGQLNAHAAALQKITNYGDEVINSAQGILLTFTRIRGDQFNDATEAVLNVATAMNTDLKSAAIQVGKALNDPAQGMDALTRSGITFTESQKEMIKQLAASGDMIGAQTIILKELETQFGGSAWAARDELGGALQSLRNAWGDLFELGRERSEVLRLAIEKLITAISDPAFVNLVQTIGVGLVQAFANLIEKVADLASAYPNVNALIQNSAAIAIQAGGAIRGMTAEITGLAEAIRLIGEGEFLKARDAWNRGQAEFIRIQEDTKRRYDAVWAEPVPGTAIGTKGDRLDIVDPFKAATPAVEDLGGALETVNDNLAELSGGAGGGVGGSASAAKDAITGVGDAARDAVDAMQGMTRSFLGDVVDGFKRGASAADTFRKALVGVLDRITSMGLDSITTPMFGEVGSLNLGRTAA